MPLAFLRPSLPRMPWQAWFLRPMQAPAKNAAVVAKLIGMVNNRREKTLTGQVRTINDGKAQP